MTTAKNPILPGFYPDPSICRVGDDFYIACSSFCYFPGVPLFHSKDLAHWESIGYALDRPEQLIMNCDTVSGGIFAPTIRYHDGLFYLIVANTSKGQTLVVTAKDPAGAWSDVHIINCTGGDPSLFWDNDGTCWCSYNHMQGIFQRRLDLSSWTLEGEEIFLWGGAAADPWSPEASHIHFKDGWYYLLIAEGGTEHYHAVCVARSRSVNGPYKSHSGNPILTHRHLSALYPICNIGHADIVDTPNGDWYMVALGSRLIGGYHKLMGRETFLCPVVWESGWPVAAPETGKVEWEYEIPLADHPFSDGKTDERDDFDLPVLTDQWNYLGTPVNRPAELKDGALVIKTTPYPLCGVPFEPGPMPDFNDEEAVRRIMAESAERQRKLQPYALGFVGRRQQHISYTAAAAVSFVPQGAQSAGMILLQEKYNHLRIELASAAYGNVIRAVRNVVSPTMPTPDDLLPVFPKELLPEGETVLGEIPYEDSEAVLQMCANGRLISFYAGADEAHLYPVAENVDAGFLGSETAGGFVGAYIGMFAAANGTDSDNEAAFDWFSYRPQ